MNYILNTREANTTHAHCVRCNERTEGTATLAITPRECPALGIAPAQPVTLVVSICPTCSEVTRATAADPGEAANPLTIPLAHLIHERVIRGERLEAVAE